MNTFIVLLRGINVSGKNRLKMQELKTMLAKDPIQNCQSYIQSGNLILSYDSSKEKLKNLIEKQLQNEFSINTEAFILTKKELLQVFNSKNYKNEATRERYFTFLNSTPNKEILTTLNNLPHHLDSFTNEGTTLYIHCPSGYSKTKFNNNYFEKKLNCKATTRNYNTLAKLVALSEQSMYH